MSHLPWNRRAVPSSRDAPPSSGSDRSVAHYREAVWAARLALLMSIVATGFALLGTAASLVSLWHSLRKRDRRSG